MIGQSDCFDFGFTTIYYVTFHIYTFTLHIFINSVHIVSTYLPTNTAFCAMVGIFILTSEVFTDVAKIRRKLCLASGTTMGVLIDLLRKI